VRSIVLVRSIVPARVQIAAADAYAARVPSVGGGQHWRAIVLNPFTQQWRNADPQARHCLQRSAVVALLPGNGSSPAKSILATARLRPPPLPLQR